MMKRKRDLQPWSMPNLPYDLLSEILSKLPVQSLLQFRTVSKTWWALIDDPDFARLHLTQFNNNRHETHLFTQGISPHTRYEFLVRCSKTFRIVPRFRFPVLDNGRNWMVVDSIDGLVVLKEHKSNTIEWLSQDSLLLWNPSIRKSRFLPPSPQILYGRRTFDLGLGFDPSIKDYKYVRFIGTNTSYYLNIDSVAVYTVGTNSWKTIELRGKGCAHYGWDCSQAPMNHIYLKGVMYLMAWDLNSMSLCLASYDLSTEVIASTNLPKDEELELVHRRGLTLADGGCSLALVSLWGDCGNLWVFENFGADNIESMTWAKRYNFSHGIYDNFLYLKKNGDMILNKWKSVTCYNSETHDERTLLNWETDCYKIAIYAWTESLILLK